MSNAFAFRHAWREGKKTWRRVGLYMGSITLGVAALVAINSFRTNILTSIQAESRNLLGADLEVHNNSSLPDEITVTLDSLETAGISVSYVTTVATMAVAPGTEFSRLVQVKAIEGGFPFYGEIGTDPPSAWEAFPAGALAVVDPAITVELDVGVGDTILINDFPLVIAGVITTSAGEISFLGAIGPRVFVAARHLASMNLIQLGSLARYQAYLKIGEPDAVQAVIDHMRPDFRRLDIGYDTVAERVNNLTEAVTNMTRFLGLVGLVALLLGGVGVASAIHVFIKERLDTVAVLRCIGATQRTVFTAYVLQATALGLGGALAGVMLGVVVQQILPGILGGFIPIDVGTSVDWWMVAVGLLLGVWVAGIFAVLPLLAIRDIPPLRALRREFEPTKTRLGAPRIVAFLGLAASVVAISVWQAPRPDIGLAFAVAISFTTGMLWLTALLLIKLTKRFFPKRAQYVIRQGVANLFRPQNQTVSVTIALGFGAFLVGTIYVVQRNILDRFDISADVTQPNLTAFDIQPDQRDSVVKLFTDAGANVSLTPLIPSRMTHINGRPVLDVLNDSTGTTRVPRWALMREYRHTYRDSIGQSERLLEGDWWDTNGATESPDQDVALVSIEQDLADVLHVGIGDHITWTVQGIPIETQIASIREVNWARLNLNFFVVFEPGSIDHLPHSTIAMARVEDPIQRAMIQRDLVRGFKNVSVVDLTLIQDAVNRIIGKVTLAIRFMALFSIASGILVLVGAIATSQFHRIRESVLLKTIGASKRQIRQIFVTEYATLGSLAGFTGVVLSGLAGWVLVRFLFELTFAIPSMPLIMIWVSAVLITTLIGLASSRRIVAKPPLAVIREINE